MRPGEVLFGQGAITLHAGLPVVELTVTNTSRHPVFVSSHFPFFEVNHRLVFDRARAWGMHLDIPAGDTVRWLPGETRTVRLIPFTGRRVIRGFNGLTDGPATPERLPGGLRRAAEAGFLSAGESPGTAGTGGASRAL